LVYSVRQSKPHKHTKLHVLSFSPIIEAMSSLALDALESAKATQA